MVENADSQMIIHQIPPVWNSESQVLILGTMPSPKSREAGFFYMHPQNRFWKVLPAVLESHYTTSIIRLTERLQFLNVVIFCFVIILPFGTYLPAARFLVPQILLSNMQFLITLTKSWVIQKSNAFSAQGKKPFHFGRKLAQKNMKRLTS